MIWAEDLACAADHMAQCIAGQEIGPAYLVLQRPHSRRDVKAELADDMPAMGHLRPQFPYLSCCNQQGFTSMLLIPSALEPAQFLEQPLRSGATDTRDP